MRLFPAGLYNVGADPAPGFIFASQDLSGSSLPVWDDGSFVGNCMSEAGSTLSVCERVRHSRQGGTLCPFWMRDLTGVGVVAE